MGNATTAFIAPILVVYFRKELNSVKIQLLIIGPQDIFFNKKILLQFIDTVITNRTGSATDFTNLK